MGIKICLSSAYHPESDGQTERYNRTLEQYLRIFTTQEQDNWVSLLPLAQLNLNSAEHSSIKMSPFKALLGFQPPFTLGTPQDIEEVPAAEERIELLKEVHSKLEENLQRAQEDYKKQADTRRIEGPELKVGQMVYLDSRNFLTKGCKKLLPKFFGPYKILDKINDVAFKLKVPQGWRRHPTFHKSLLKPAFGIPEEQTLNPEEDKTYEVEKILNHKRIGRGYRFLISWKGYEWFDSSWEPESNLQGCKEILAEYKHLHSL